MILLTGVTGKTGGATAQALIARGVRLRAIVRDAGKAAALKAAGVDLVVGDVADPAVLDRAMADVEKALLIMANSQRQLELEQQFVDAARRAGVRHLVKMSSMEATADARSPIPRIHYQSELYVEKSGMDWTFIKPNFFMQNLLGSAATIKDQDKFFLPMGEGRTAMIDVRDIGAAAAAVLAGNGHAGKRYEVTGPEVLSFADVAMRFSKVLGRKIDYVNVPMAGYRQTLARFLTNEWHLNAVCDLFGEIAAGHALHTTDTVRALTGTPPRSLEQFVTEYRALYSA